MMNKEGVFVVSLDFEMMWGCHDWATIAGYGQSNVRQVRAVFSQLLELFNDYGIHATVAFVGLLLNTDVEDVIKNMPVRIPSYQNQKLNPLRDSYLSSILGNDEDLFFAKDVIEKLKAVKEIELASHTYSHYNCWASGQTLDDFCSDSQRMIEISQKHGIELRSIVFPRNEVSDDYLKECRKMGFIAYRGNPKHLFNKGGRIKSFFNRVFRFLDTYLPISNNCVPLDEIKVTEGLIDVQASRFLRPYDSRLAFLDSLKIRRIKYEMTKAARRGELYHLWWHPHNFGSCVNKNIVVLKKILETFKYCQEKYGMKTLNMGEFATCWKQTE